jgi:hypothetical protein
MLKRLDAAYFGIPSLINDLKEAVASDHLRVRVIGFIPLSNYS